MVFRRVRVRILGFCFWFFVSAVFPGNKRGKDRFSVLLGSEIFTVLLLGKKIIRKSALFYLSG